MSKEASLRTSIFDLVHSAMSGIEHAQILDSVSFMTLLFDNQSGKIEWASKSFLEYLGYEMADIKGRLLFDFVYDADKKGTMQAFEEFKRGEKITSLFSNRYYHKDGSLRNMCWVREDAHFGINGLSYSFCLKDCSGAHAQDYN